MSVVHGSEPEGRAAMRDERRRLAQDLHDSTSQMLVVLQFELGKLKRSGSSEANAVIEEIEQIIHEMREQIRAVARE